MPTPAPGATQIGTITAGRDVLIATRDIVTTVLPSGRFGRLAVFGVLAALLVVTGITLENWGCERFSICVLGDENIARLEQISPTVAQIELGAAREAPALDVIASGLVVTAGGVQGLLISSGPMPRTVRAVPRTASDDDVRAAAERLAAMRLDALARLVTEHRRIFAAHPTLSAAVADRIGGAAHAGDCAAVDAEGWRAAARRALLGEDASVDPLALSLLASALECDREALPGLQAMDRL